MHIVHFNASAFERRSTHERKDPISSPPSGIEVNSALWSELPMDLRQGSYASYYDPQFIMGMLIGLRSMMKGLGDTARLRLLKRASRMENLHGQFVQDDQGFVLFRPEDGPELMLDDDRSLSLARSAKSKP